MKEIFKNIPGYKNHYQISTLGNLKSLKFGKEKILKQSIDSYGYAHVILSKNNVKKGFTIHKLMVLTFFDKYHNPKLVCDHIDNVKLNNNINNLQLITIRENSSKDQFRLNRYSRFVGVSFNKNLKKWTSQIHINKKLIHLGVFCCETKAHLTYQNKLKNLYYEKTYI